MAVRYSTIFEGHIVRVVICNRNGIRQNQTRADPCGNTQDTRRRTHRVRGRETLYTERRQSPPTKLWASFCIPLPPEPVRTLILFSQCGKVKRIFEFHMKNTRADKAFGNSVVVTEGDGGFDGRCERERRERGRREERKGGRSHS